MKKIPFYIRLLALCVLLPAVFSCRSSRLSHQTEPLFLLPDRIRISHPSGASSGRHDGGAHILSEQVRYASAPDEESLSLPSAGVPARLDTNHIYALSGVTVVSRARFAPVREGHVDIDFAIHVPKGFLSDDYHIWLTPELLHNDSVVVLADVVLRGKNFVKKQEADYDRYERYLSSIVDPSGYDTAFIDRRAAEKELERRRKEEIRTYYARWKQYRKYLAWQSARQAAYDTYNVRSGVRLTASLASLDQAYRSRLSRALAVGRDTSSLGRDYRRKRERLIASAPARRQITLGTVPARYREFYLGGIRPQDIAPALPGSEDSVRIASGYVLYERIALNELRGSRREEIFERMVPAPYCPEAHYNAVISPGWNFNYRYTTPYPVTPGLKTLRLTLKGHIMAVDGSNYTLHPVDTLHYVISSLDELADGLLMANPSFTDTERQEYGQALSLLKNRQYERALSLLNAYTDYNTALALACLGYDRQAYELLRQLPANAHVHYLSAIVCCRLHDEQEAIRRLKQACELDESKLLRMEKDPEISRLARTYRLEMAGL